MHSQDLGLQLPKGEAPHWALTGFMQTAFINEHTHEAFQNSNLFFFFFGSLAAGRGTRLIGGNLWSRLFWIFFFAFCMKSFLHVQNASSVSLSALRRSP